MQRLRGCWGPGGLDSPGKGGDVGGAKQGCDKGGSHADVVVEVGRGEERLRVQEGGWAAVALGEEARGAVSEEGA